MRLVTRIRRTFVLLSNLNLRSSNYGSILILLGFKSFYRLRFNRHRVSGTKLFRFILWRIFLDYGLVMKVADRKMLSLFLNFLNIFIQTWLWRIWRLQTACAHNLRAMLLIKPSFDIPSNGRVHTHLSRCIDHDRDWNYEIASSLILNVKTSMLDHHRVPVWRFGG